MATRYFLSKNFFRNLLYQDLLFYNQPAALFPFPFFLLHQQTIFLFEVAFLLLHLQLQLPEKYVRPRELVTKMGYEPSDAAALLKLSSADATQEVIGPKLVKEYNIQKLETCWTCHR